MSRYWKTKSVTALPHGWVNVYCDGEDGSGVFENRLRASAQRQGRGLRLVKSRRLDPKALDYGLYVLVADSAGNRRLRVPRPGSRQSPRARA